jgi:sulfhydrogenase subunit gamma (sulfur reductase)
MTPEISGQVSKDLGNITNPYLPNLARIIRVTDQTPDIKTFQFRFEDEALRNSFTFKPGQFAELSVIGVGEAPISINSSPTRRGFIDLCVRDIGSVTHALHKMGQNDLVGLRGPYGNGYPVEAFKGHDVLIMAAGLGMAAVRSLIYYLSDNRQDYGKVTIIYGSRYADGLLNRDELEWWRSRGDFNVMLCLSRPRPEENWTGYKGHIHQLMDTDDFRQFGVDPKQTYAVVCGPPNMYKDCAAALLKQGYSKDNILMNLERRMKCGVGKCCHCAIGSKYTCIDGPVFNYWDAMNVPELI